MRFLTTATLCLALGAGASAQNLLVNDPAAGGFFESQGTSMLTAVVGFGVPVMPHPAAFPMPPSPIPFGAITADDGSGLIWYTDGFLVAAEPNPAYPGFAAIAPIPPTPFPPGLPGPVTGMAVDSTLGRLFITDGFTVATLAAAPGTPLLGPIFPMPFAGAPVSGLDWDPITNTLWGVELTGFAWNFFVGGAPVTGAPIPPPPPFAGPATGIAIDKTGVVFGQFRSLYVLEPTTIIDYATGIPVPSFGVPGSENGLTWIANPSATPPGGVCPCPGMPFGQVVTGPMSTANPGFSVDITGLVPGTTVFYMFDFLGFDPTFPPASTVGCPLGMTAAGIFTITVNAGPGGTATLPIPLGTAPIGTRLYMQQLMLCAADTGPFGVVLTPMHQVIVSAP